MNTDRILMKHGSFDPSNLQESRARSTHKIRAGLMILGEFWRFFPLSTTKNAITQWILTGFSYNITDSMRMDCTSPGNPKRPDFVQN